MAKTKSQIQSDYLKRTNYASNSKYNKNKTVLYAIRVVRSTENDIIEYLEKYENKSGHIKQLIREEIKRQSKDV